MAARTKPVPAAQLVITDDEITELEAPWRAELGSRGTVVLKSSASFSLDDYYAIADKADEDPRQIIGLLAYDEGSAQLLRTIGHVLLKRILTGWFAQVGVATGESVSSET